MLIEIGIVICAMGLIKCDEIVMCYLEIVHMFRTQITTAPESFDR